MLAGFSKDRPATFLSVVIFLSEKIILITKLWEYYSVYFYVRNESVRLFSKKLRFSYWISIE